ncbi:hypothetical protein C1645_834876 [Glomus cerebriforme]|uniref:Uncharacterized protein n=1 Tax=Glomus cerebriforme TaxID=658196 RepID=A0A397S9V8_9GLOM|nr:hypothetical protein C1645_834876 [Glomus cerebriforme]
MLIEHVKYINVNGIDYNWIRDIHQSKAERKSSGGKNKEKKSNSKKDSTKKDNKKNCHQRKIRGGKDKMRGFATGLEVTKIENYK